MRRVEHSHACLWPTRSVDQVPQVVLRLETEHLACAREVVERRIRILRVDLGPANFERALQVLLEPLQRRVRRERRRGGNKKALERSERTHLERSEERRV